MTEDEAREKWCPFARESGDNGYPASNCVASACMAWRRGPDLWRQTTKSGADTNEQFDRGRLWAVGSNALKDPWLEAVAVPQGFCGLAGQPS
jgi:hypothetical protein